MKILCPLILSFSIVASQAAVIVLTDDNYDGTNVSSAQLNAGSNSTVTPTADPTGSGMGNVGSLDIEPGGQWGEVRGTSGGSTDFAIPAVSTPGVDTFDASFDIYIPSGTTFATTTAADRVTLILRWNITNTGNTSIGADWDSFTPDTWQTVSLTGVLPANGGDGNPLNMVTPILSFRDQNNDAVTGVSAYIDNWNLSVTGVPEPSAGILALLGGVLMLRRRR